MEDILAVCASETRLTIAADLLQPDQLVVTHTVGEWKKQKPDIQKRPAIFGIGK